MCFNPINDAICFKGPAFWNRKKYSAFHRIDVIIILVSLALDHTKNTDI